MAAKNTATKTRPTSTLRIVSPSPYERKRPAPGPNDSDCNLIGGPFRKRSRHAEQPQQPTSQRATQQRPDHRYRGIAPVGAAFAGDWQQEVRHARAQVARRIYRVPGGTAQRKTDSPNKAPDQVRSQRSPPTARTDLANTSSHHKTQ